MLAGSTLVIVVLVLAVVIVGVLLAIWRISVKREIRGLPASQPAGMRDVDQALVEPGEQAASLIGEQIEAMVRSKLAEYPDLAAAPLDFGTGEDGSLVIWFQGKKYEGVDEVPEPRLRQAIQSAVQAFNEPPQASSG
jgi:hypothetical protein